MTYDLQAEAREAGAVSKLVISCPSLRNTQRNVGGVVFSFDGGGRCEVPVVPGSTEAAEAFLRHNGHRGAKLAEVVHGRHPISPFPVAPPARGEAGVAALPDEVAAPVHPAFAASAEDAVAEDDEPSGPEEHVPAAAPAPPLVEVPAEDPVPAPASDPLADPPAVPEGEALEGFRAVDAEMAPESSNEDQPMEEKPPTAKRQRGRQL